MSYPLTDRVFIDLETSGLNKEEDKILQIGAIKFRYIDHIGSLNLFVNQELDEKTIKKFSHIEYRIKHGFEEKSALETLINFIGSSLIISHNIPHDLGFLNKALLRNGMKPLENNFLDTLSLSKHRTVYPHTLEGMCRKYNVTYDKNENGTHNALFDSWNLYALYEELEQESLKYEDEIEWEGDEEQMEYFINRICYFENYPPPEYVPTNAVVEPIRRLTSSNKIKKRFVDFNIIKSL